MSFLLRDDNIPVISEISILNLNQCGLWNDTVCQIYDNN